MSWKITAASHLAAELLQAFEYGTLPEEHIPAVEAHLRSCAACCDLLAGLPEDGFLSRLRHACEKPPTLTQSGPSSSPSPKNSLTFPEAATELTGGAAPSLPGYEDVRELGRGGMGVVYAATHAIMGRRVALKVIHADLSVNPDVTARFRREVRAVARLAHPHIVTAYDAGEVGGGSFWSWSTWTRRVWATAWNA